MAAQWTPIKSSKHSNIVEPIEWRDDRKCGEKYPNSLQTPAKCNQPYTGDKVNDEARCCMEGHCLSLNETNGCVRSDETLY